MSPGRATIELGRFRAVREPPGRDNFCHLADQRVPPLTLATPPALDPSALPAGAVDGLYVHVPFCVHKCHYCDFYSITRQGEDRMARFVELLLAEADLWLASPVGAAAKPRTVFFGGGTPTLLPK